MEAISRFYILLCISAIFAFGFFISCANPHFHGQCFIFNCFRNYSMAAIDRFYILLYILVIVALGYFIFCANPHSHGQCLIFNCLRNLTWRPLCNFIFCFICRRLLHLDTSFLVLTPIFMANASFSTVSGILVS